MKLSWDTSRVLRTHRSCALAVEPSEDSVIHVTCLLVRLTALLKTKVTFVMMMRMMMMMMMMMMMAIKAANSTLHAEKS